MSTSYTRNPLHTVLAAVAAVFVILSGLVYLQPNSNPISFAHFGSGRSAHFTPDIQRRLKDSEEKWALTVLEREEIYARRGGVKNIPLLGNPGEATIWDILSATFSCPYSTERIGRMGDGGKWVCGVETLGARGSDALIYSIGVNTESSFEAELLDRYPEATVYGYDLSVDHWGPQIYDNVKYDGRAFFNKFGISAQDEPDQTPPNYSLKTMMAMNGHDYIDIFKIDVEGAEWSVIEALVEEYKDGELPFGQLQIEIHAKPFGHLLTAARMDRFWRKLEAEGLRPFSLEVNYSITRFEGLYYVEYGFINTKSSKSALLGH